MLSISVLGPIEVRRAGQLVAVPAGKTSELLVRLALEAGRPVRTDRLLDDLWGDDAASISRNTVQSKVTKLRRALGDVVVGAEGGYTLAVDAADIDALVVPARAAEVASLLEAGDHRAAAQCSADTLRLFRGDVLAGAGDGEWVAPHRARLEAARVQLLEAGCSARLALGEAADVIGELELAVAEHPYRESVWVLLITALYQAGRQTDALATYQRVRRLLGDELGLEPGPQLQQIEQQVLQHDPTIEPRAPAPLAAIAGNLPPITTDLVGRDREAATLGALLDQHRLVELVGPGGIGKTALAIAAARTVAATAPSGGVWLARLETAVTEADVIDTLIAAVNVTGGQSALLERFKGTTALVLLDNCEHVVPEAADLALRLLDASPGVRVLCTSQVPLGLDGEQLLELQPLALDDAADLFTRRAAAQRVHQRPTDGREAVVELCRSLDGLPLAIELAAARTKTLSIEDITRRLDDRFNLLSDPTSRRPERRRALRATIGWSYELLFQDDQRGLWALATFAGGAPLDAVEVVLAALGVPPAAAIDVVGRLAARSLVIVDGDDRVRYRLLDSVRAFALEAMDDAGMTEVARAAHAAWLADAARTSTDGVRSAQQAEHLTFARDERANIDAALAWSATHDPLLALNIAIGFGWAWVVLGDSRASQRILAALAAAGSAGAPDDRATALLLTSWLEASTGDLATARAHIAQATAIADENNDVDLQARSHYYLAYVVSHEGGFREALDLTDRSAQLYAGLDRDWDRVANAMFAARAAISAGDELRAVQRCDELDHWMQRIDDPWMQSRRDAMQGELARLQRRFDDAVVHVSRALEVSHRLGFLQTEAYQTATLGRAQAQAGDDEAGATTLALAIAKAEAIGDTRMATLARVHLGRVLRALGRDEAARQTLQAAAVWHRAAGGGEQALLGDCLLAAIDCDEAALRTTLDAARATDAAHVEVFALDALAKLAWERNDLDGARALWAEADSRMRLADHFITDRDRVDERRAVGE